MILRRLPRWAWSLAALALILAYDALAVPGFLQISFLRGQFSGSLVTMCVQAAPLALVSLGMTLVVATGGVDLSVGAVMAIAASLAASQLGRGASPGTALALACAAAAAAGLLNGALVTRLRLPPIVATLTVLVAGRGVAQIIGAGQVQEISNPAFLTLGSGFFLGVPIPILVTLGAAAIMIALLRGSAFGLFLAATGERPAAARLAGVPVIGVVLIAYVLCGVLAGVAGIVQAADAAAADANRAGAGIELDAIVAVVLGGTALRGGRARLGGAVIGALLVQAVTMTLQLSSLAAEATIAVKAGIVLLICVPQVAYGASRRGAALAASTHGAAVGGILGRLPALPAAAVLALGFIAAATLLPGFASWDFISGSLLGDSGVLGLAALAMTLVVLTSGIDLSVGAVAALSSMIFAKLLVDSGWSVPAALALVTAIGALFGALQGSLVAILSLPPFLVTLIGMYLARGIAQLIDSEARIALGTTADAWTQWRLAGLPIQACVWIVASAAAAIVLQRTRWGRRVHAIGGDLRAASLMGIPVVSTQVSVYAAASALAALAGALGAISVGAGDSQQSTLMELDAIAAVVIGGTALAGGVGGSFGTVIGVLTLSIAGAALNYAPNLSSWWIRIASGGLLLFFLLLQRGLSVLSIPLPTPAHPRISPAPGSPAGAAPSS